MSRKKIALWVLALLVCAGFARLGFWQYGRMQEKQALLAQVAEVMRDKHPRSFNSDVELAGIDWVEGVVDVLPPTLLLDNQMREGRPGVHVYCILQAVGAVAPRRLADFGWHAVAANRAMPDVACPRGRLQIRGLETPAPSSGLKLGPAMQSIGKDRWLMTRVDDKAIFDATHLDVTARVIRLDPALKLGWERDLDVLPNTLPPERHLGYAVQWWALSLAVFITALVLSIRKPRKQ